MTDSTECKPDHHIWISETTVFDTVRRICWHCGLKQERNWVTK